MTEKQKEMYGFLKEHPKSCYYCISKYMGVELTVTIKRLNSMWKKKKVIDKWKADSCGLCEATGRFTFTVKDDA